MRRIVSYMLMILALLAGPVLAWASESGEAALAPSAEDTLSGSPASDDAASRALSSNNTTDGALTLSADNLSATLEGCPFALGNFERASKGSNRAIDNTYYGYTYLIGSKANDLMYMVTSTDVVVYIDQEAAARVGLNPSLQADQEYLRQIIEALDTANENGSSGISSQATWHFTTDTAVDINGVVFSFNQQLAAFSCC